MEPNEIKKLINGEENVWLGELGPTQGSNLFVKLAGTSPVVD